MKHNRMLTITSLLLVLGVTSIFSLILSARGLRSLLRGRAAASSRPLTSPG